MYLFRAYWVPGSVFAALVVAWTFLAHMELTLWRGQGGRRWNFMLWRRVEELGVLGVGMGAEILGRPESSLKVWRKQANGYLEEYSQWRKQHIQRPWGRRRTAFGFKVRETVAVGSCKARSKACIFYFEVGGKLCRVWVEKGHELIQLLTGTCWLWLCENRLKAGSAGQYNRASRQRKAEGGGSDLCGGVGVGGR